MGAWLLLVCDMLTGITIDDEATRDMDDAVWVEAVDGGGWHVRVMIADVANAVRMGTETDRIAMSKVETRYFAHGNNPMLPRYFSEDRLSLRPGEPREVLVVDLMLGDGLGILDTLLFWGVLESEARLSYSDIPGILADKEHPLHDLIERMSRLANGLLLSRRNRGALAFYDLKKGWVTSEEGSLRQLKRREDTVGYVIIQELMILANMAVAEYAVKNDVPILYRNHTARSAAPEREELMRLLESVAVVPIENLAAIRHTTHMMFNRAEYGATILGHFGLNLGAYTHFTSPIRRYADLVNHRQIRAYVRDEPLPYKKEDIQALASHVNHMLIEYDRAKDEYMKKKADRMAEEAVLSGRLEDMGDGEFERVTKLLAGNGEDCPEAYYDAAVNRIDSGRMPVPCEGLILLQAPNSDRWAELKRALLERLAEEPNRAVTMFNLAQQTCGWDMHVYDVTEERISNLPVFTAKATISVEDNRFESPESKDMTKKGAMQRASVGLLAAILGLPVPEIEVFKPPPPPVPEEKDVEINAGKDPIVALQEYCQAKRLPLPEYAFKIEGQANRPTITCTCTFGPKAETGQASSKQRAKRLAARAMIYTLLNLR
jgi:ribonuclease R